MAAFCTRPLQAPTALDTSGLGKKETSKPIEMFRLGRMGSEAVQTRPDESEALALLRSR